MTKPCFLNPMWTFLSFIPWMYSVFILITAILDLYFPFYFILCFLYTLLFMFLFSLLLCLLTDWVFSNLLFSSIGRKFSIIWLPLKWLILAKYYCCKTQINIWQFILFILPVKPFLITPKLFFIHPVKFQNSLIDL